MAKYSAKVGEWVTPSENTGSIQNLGNVPIEISAVNEENTGIKLESGQMVNFDGTVYVRSAGNKSATFTTVPFKVIAGGGEGGGGGSYILPTASSTVKGGIKVGDRLSITDEKLSADRQIDLWKTNKQYTIGDTVIVKNNIYRCIMAHTSGASFNDDISNWVRLDKDATNLPNWASNIEYDVNDLIYYNGSLYRCSSAHTSSTSFDSSKFQFLVSTNTKILDWKQNTVYEKDNVVCVDNHLYRCLSNHTSTTTFDSTKWEEIDGIDSYILPWQTKKDYKVGNIVFYDNVLYVCNTNHTSDTADFNNDRVNWDLFSKTTAKILDYESNKYYEVNQCIRYNDWVYRCTIAHVSAATFDDTEKTKWQELYKLVTKIQIDNMFI